VDKERLEWVCVWRSRAVAGVFSLASSLNALLYVITEVLVSHGGIAALLREKGVIVRLKTNDALSQFSEGAQSMDPIRNGVDPIRYHFQYRPGRRRVLGLLGINCTAPDQVE
jgi:hypothetical protein